MPKKGAMGTRLLKKDDLDAYVDIAHISTINGPGFSLDTEDATTHDSEDGWEEVVATVLRTGEVGLELEFDPEAASHTALLDSMVSKELGEYKLVFPNMTTTCWGFKAFVTSFNPSAPHSGKITASATLKISGKPNLSDTLPVA